MGQRESRKHHPSLCIMVVRWKKSIAFTFLCSFVPVISQPALRLFGWTKQSILRAPKARSRESLLVEECVQTRRSHQQLKDKGSGASGNASFALILLIETCLE